MNFAKYGIIKQDKTNLEWDSRSTHNLIKKVLTLTCMVLSNE